jgi:hypothetical protein
VDYDFPPSITRNARRRSGAVVSGLIGCRQLGRPKERPPSNTPGGWKCATTLGGAVAGANARTRGHIWWPKRSGRRKVPILKDHSKIQRGPVASERDQYPKSGVSAAGPAASAGTRLRIQSRPSAQFPAMRGSNLRVPALMAMLSRVLSAILCSSLCASAYAQGRPSLIPGGWTQTVSDAETRTRKFESPDGRASLIARQIVTQRAAPGRDLDRVAYRDDERVTYHRRASSWVAVSGYRDGKIFYRKINLACGGTRWNFVELEYPRDIKRQMDATVTHIARGMTFYSDDCGQRN